jgi:hypothetical protein
MDESLIVNVADAPAYRHPAAGMTITFERFDQPFAETGINIRVLQPGQTNGSTTRSTPRPASTARPSRRRRGIPMSPTATDRGTGSPPERLGRRGQG